MTSLDLRFKIIISPYVSVMVGSLVQFLSFRFNFFTKDFDVSACYEGILLFVTDDVTVCRNYYFSLSQNGVSTPN